MTMINTDSGFITSYKLHLTTHDKKHKMAGLQSISTSVLDNPICQKRREVPDSICAKCYANHLCRYRKSLQTCLSRNFSILNDHLFDEREALRCQFDTRYGRIESFGDVASVTQARNYIRIIRAHKHTQFGIWSKNLVIWGVAFEKDGKPKNCSYVHSSLKVDIPDYILPRWQKYVDHVFTVWSPEIYDDLYKGTPSECAGIKCMNCLKCYKRGGQYYINERLR